MRVEQVMTADVKTCRKTDMLDAAVQIMRDYDVGAVPVVDMFGQLVGIVTDRDACMAAHTQALPLHSIPCAVAMTKHTVTCRPDDPHAELVKLMAKHKIRRVPVVDDAQKPIGIVSLDDIALAMAFGGDISAGEVAETLAAISEHQPHVTERNRRS